MNLSPDPTTPSKHAWHWQSWEGLPYLICDLLHPWPHGFFTALFSPRGPDQLVNILQPEALVYRVCQVHGNAVLTPSEIEHMSEEATQDAQEAESPQADGIITEKPWQSAWVCSADCTPVLIGDRQTGQVAAVHAGWRGTASRIVPNAIARFLEAGSPLEELRVAMGPAISGKVYQVSESVAAQVGASIVSSYTADTTTWILDVLQQSPDSPILEDPQPGRLRLDVRRVIELQLKQLGMKAEHVAIAPHCTYQEPEHFFSYRRDKLKKVQWSGIVSRPL